MELVVDEVDPLLDEEEELDEVELVVDEVDPLEDEEELDEVELVVDEVDPLEDDEELLELDVDELTVQHRVCSRAFLNAPIPFKL